MSKIFKAIVPIALALTLLLAACGTAPATANTATEAPDGIVDESIATPMGTETPEANKVCGLVKFSKPVTCITQELMLVPMDGFDFVFDITVESTENGKINVAMTVEESVDGLMWDTYCTDSLNNTIMQWPYTKKFTINSTTITRLTCKNGGETIAIDITLPYKSQLAATITALAPTLVPTATPTLTTPYLSIAIDGVTFGEAREIGTDNPDFEDFSSAAFWFDTLTVLSSSAETILWSNGSGVLLKSEPTAAYKFCLIETAAIAHMTIRPCYIHQNDNPVKSFAAPGLINDWEFYASKVEGGPMLYSQFIGTETPEPATPTRTPRPTSIPTATPKK